LLAALAVIPSAAHGAQIEGVLIDRMCSSKAEVRVIPGGHLAGGMIVAQAHDRDCALMPECRQSGYGVFTYDNKFLKFDEAGNRKALAAIKASKKAVDLEVDVTGEVQGDTIKVASLRLRD
jgi:hypothetical protein